MDFFKFLRLRKKTADTPPDLYKDVLNLWEDDYRMLELLPKENTEFAKAEITRINDFGKEHFNGHGFTEITSIGENPFKTIEKLIDISEVNNLMVGAGLNKIGQFHMQGVGLLQGEKAPLGFGLNKFAIMCEKRNNLLTDIWVTGRTRTEDERQKLIDALLLFGQTFNFIAVNWYCGQYYNLVERSSVEEFVAASIS
jgi:hypothetical protein